MRSSYLLQIIKIDCQDSNGLDMLKNKVAKQYNSKNIVLHKLSNT